MGIAGNLADFSLSELFQFLEQGHKTGRLTIEVLIEDNNQKMRVHHLWLHQGRVIAASDRLDRQGLMLAIAQRGWMTERVVSRVVQICPINTPMGLCLKSQGLLQAEQLKLLFNSQVLRQVCALFQVKDGLFTFRPMNSTETLPFAEMTGLSMPATETTLMGLRALKDWSALTEKLPDPTSALTGLVSKQLDMQLDAREWQVWEFVNGNISLQKIAKHLRVPVEVVQQIAFRLIVVGLAEEQFMSAFNPTCSIEELTPTITHTMSPPEILPEISQQKPPVSQSFLKNLMSFLRVKV
ncbi:DUF4388 domain-containing protein [Scytonema sp. NUACC26]|uniref:DUF4388 domain-containing protein n=1 Tax=Scytonema sp. NUACC26 TaxID=3140176 RepID=UPI0034DC0FA6